MAARGVKPEPAPPELAAGAVECSRREVVEVRRRVFRLVRVFQGRQKDRGVAADLARELSEWDLDPGALLIARDLTPKERRALAARLAAVGLKMSIRGSLSHWPIRALEQVSAVLVGAMPPRKRAADSPPVASSLSDRAQRLLEVYEQRAKLPWPDA
jgi:hypothetical protein